MQQLFFEMLQAWYALNVAVALMGFRRRQIMSHFERNQSEIQLLSSIFQVNTNHITYNKKDNNVPTSLECSPHQQRLLFCQCVYDFQ